MHLQYDKMQFSPTIMYKSFVIVPQDELSPGSHLPVFSFLSKKI
jgi:hypothetical protein